MDIKPVLALVVVEGDDLAKHKDQIPTLLQLYGDAAKGRTEIHSLIQANVPVAKIYAAVFPNAEGLPEAIKYTSKFLNSDGKYEGSSKCGDDWHECALDAVEDWMEEQAEDKDPMEYHFNVFDAATGRFLESLEFQEDDGEEDDEEDDDELEEEDDEEQEG